MCNAVTCSIGNYEFAMHRRTSGDLWMSGDWKTLFYFDSEKVKAICTNIFSLQQMHPCHVSSRWEPRS